jgi:hypothetical protein
VNKIAEPSQARAKETRLVQALGGRHGSLDGKASNVLPALLKKRDEVVNGQHDVGNELLLSHLNVADGDTHAENLLELELDGGLDLVDAASQVVGVRDGGGELAGLGQTRTQETRDLLDESLGSDEGIVLAGKLLDELLVLVELLQVISGHGVDTTVLGTIDIVLVTENAAKLLVMLFLFPRFLLRSRTRWTCWGGGWKAGGWCQRNACHAEGHSSSGRSEAQRSRGSCASWSRWSTPRAHRLAFGH